MEIKKSELLNALSIVKPALSNKEIIEQATSFAFINGSVIAYNDEIAISHPVPGLELVGAVKAEELYKLLGKLKVEELDIQVTNNEVQIKSGRAKAGFIMEQEITLPIDQVLQERKWKKLPEGFSVALFFCAQVCSSDMSRPVLTCVHIINGFMEATDGFRLVKYKVSGLSVEQSVLLPSSSAMEIVKLKPIQMSITDGWIHFKNEVNTVISARIIVEQEYVKIGHFLEVDGDNITFPKTVLDLIEKASVFSKRDHFQDEKIGVTIMNNRLKIRAQSDTGWFEEDINFKTSGLSIAFQITPYLFKDILKQTLDCIINDSLIKFSTENWQYVAIITTGE